MYFSHKYFDLKSLSIQTSLVFLICLFCVPEVTLAQSADEKPIVLKNPGLESQPKAGRAFGKGFYGWSDCNKPGQTNVDIQPGFFEVDTEPKEGSSYVGMVVRQDETWEGISTLLMRPLKAQSCYTFTAFLAKSANYLSLSAATGKEENFANPVKLRIWGGNHQCSKKELLAESPLINHTDWKEYSFKFEPTSTHLYMSLEVFYKTPTLFPYNGNILVDDLGAIIPIPCEEEIEEIKRNPPIVNIASPAQNGISTTKPDFKFSAEVANVNEKSELSYFYNGQKVDFEFNAALGVVNSKVKLSEGPNRFRLVAKTKDGESQESRTVNYKAPVLASNTPPKKTFVPKVLDGLKDRRFLKEGKTIPMKNMVFMADSSRIEKENFPILEDIFGFMMVNEDISIEIGGHTNNRCAEEFCRKLSEKRAKSVVEFLVEKGIPVYRLKYRGYGKSKPIATNDTATGRKKNQRVEIKILRMDG